MPWPRTRLSLLLVVLSGAGCTPPLPDPALQLATFPPCPREPDEGIAVLGAVNKPQSLPMQPGLTLVRAILLSGGFNVLAYRRRVRLLRCNRAILLDVERIQYGEAQDPPLLPGDNVFVSVRD